MSTLDRIARRLASPIATSCCPRCVDLVDDPADLLEERLVYRGDFALGTLMRFLPIVTQIFLWGADLRRRRRQPATPIAGYTYDDMIAYYLLTMVSRAFSSMPGLAASIARRFATARSRST